MENFTPVPALVGGGLIGLAVGLYLLFLGKVLGISGILENLLKARSLTPLLFSLTFMISLAVGAYLAKVAQPGYVPDMEIRVSWPVIFLAGILTGFGARLGAGCTSGHGISGVARLSKRSLVATAVFMTVTTSTVYIIRHVPVIQQWLS